MSLNLKKSGKIKLNTVHYHSQSEFSINLSFLVFLRVLLESRVVFYYDLSMNPNNNVQSNDDIVNSLGMKDEGEKEG